MRDGQTQQHINQTDRHTSTLIRQARTDSERQTDLHQDVNLTDKDKTVRDGQIHTRTLIRQTRNRQINLHPDRQTDSERQTDIQQDINQTY